MRILDTTLKLLCFFLASSISLAAFAGGGGKLDFKNSTLISGTAGADGAVYRFPNVDKGLDALVTIKGRADALTYLVDIDMVTSGFDKAWQPQVGYNSGTAPGPADWWMEFEIVFVEKGTTKPEEIKEFVLSAIDIDGNGHLIREYVAMYGFESYMLETNSVLALTNVTGTLGNPAANGKRFDGPTLNYLNIDTSGTAVMTSATYTKTTSFSVRVGGVSSGVSGASDRMYSLYFQEFKYSQPQTAVLPVHLTAFDATLIGSVAKVDWKWDSEAPVSHFSVQRSDDGKEFKDINVVFADGAAEYSFKESIAKEKQNLQYYRLKIVDMGGKFTYSAVRVVKLNGIGNKATISAYPNPVVSELRITIPDSWQSTPVVYEMLSANGNVVKTRRSTSASQTETISTSGLQPGVYFIRLSAGNEVAINRIVKN